MDTTTNGRIAAAHGRASRAKRVLAAAAAAMFAAVLVGARLSHPGQAAATGSGASPAADLTSSDDAQAQDFEFGQSDIGPSVSGGSAPSGSTHAS